MPYIGEQAPGGNYIWDGSSWQVAPGVDLGFGVGVDNPNAGQGANAAAQQAVDQSGRAGLYAPSDYRFAAGAQNPDSRLYNAPGGGGNPMPDQQGGGVTGGSGVAGGSRTSDPEGQMWFNDIRRGAYPNGYFGGGGGGGYTGWGGYRNQPNYGGGGGYGIDDPGWAYSGQGGGYGGAGNYGGQGGGGNVLWGGGYQPAQGMGGNNYDWASQMGGQNTNLNRQAQAQAPQLQQVPVPWQANIARYNEMSPTGRGLLQGAAGQAGYDWNDYQSQMRAAAPQGQPIRQTSYGYAKPRGAWGAF